MDELKKLIDIVKKQGQRSLQIIEREYKSKQPTKDNQLYQAIISCDYKTEDEIAFEVFNTNKEDRNFKITKAKLKEKLLNNLFLLDYHKSDFTDFERAEYDCLHTFHQGKVLMMEGDGENAVRILSSLEKKAYRFELYSIAYESLLLIRKQYASWGKNSLFDKLTKRISTVRQKSKIVDAYEEKFQWVSASINKSQNAVLLIKDDIRNLIPELKEKSVEFKIKKLDVLAEKLNISLGWIDHDFDQIMESCNYLEQKYVPEDITQIKVDLHPRYFYKNSIRALYVVKEFKNGLQYLNDRLPFEKKGTCNWYWLEEYKLLLYLGLRQYKNASDVLVELKSCRNHIKNEEELNERITIYRLYLLYFLPHEKQLYWGFHWEELLRQRIEYPENQKALQIAFLILQFLFFLKNIEIEELKNTLERLKPYSAEHLSRKNNYRTSVLVRMLEVVVERNFDHTAIIERCTNYSCKLKNSTINSETDHEFEVLPYEHIWQEVLKILSEKKDYKHYRFYHLYEMNEH